jgi:hypothetical protein
MVAAVGTRTQDVAAQGAGQPKGAEVRIVVSAEPRHGNNLPTIYREDVLVREGSDPERDRVIEWVPTKGERAGLELLVLVDDGSDTNLGSQLADLRSFINQQAPTTLVGLGYMRNGTVDMVRDFTQDHAAAARSLRLPMGNEGGSPYFSLTEFVKRWPANASRPRREVLLISNGIDPNYDETGSNPYVDAAIEDAQQAGIVVFTIYTPGAGHYGHSLWRINWGQNYLSQLADETGGESYMLGFGPAVSFAPYLDQVNHRLQNQYLLTFLAKTSEKSGVRRIRVTTEVSNVDLVAPSKVFVPAATAQ